MSAPTSPPATSSPLPEINVVCRLEPATESPELAVNYTVELFDALCDAYDADPLGVRLPLPAARAPSDDGIGAPVGFDCCRSSAATPPRDWPR